MIMGSKETLATEAEKIKETSELCRFQPELMIQKQQSIKPRCRCMFGYIVNSPHM